MVDTEQVAGLAIGYFGGQFLGNYVENKIKPGIAATATDQDKMIAVASNDGTKIAIAYGAYSIGKTNQFLKHIGWGSVLSAVIDAGWRYTHSGVPYGYMPFNIPLLGDLNGLISGPNPGNNNHLMTDKDTTETILAKGRELLALPAPPMSPAKKQAICSSIKTDAITKNRSYTAQEMEMCSGLLSGYDNLQTPAPVPGTSPGDITPPGDITAPNQDEYTPSTIPDRKSRFAFMGEEKARHFGFALGSPTSLREKYFGMKT